MAKYQNIVQKCDCKPKSRKEGYKKRRQSVINRLGSCHQYSGIIWAGRPKLRSLTCLGFYCAQERKTPIISRSVAQRGFRVSMAENSKKSQCFTWNKNPLRPFHVKPKTAKMPLNSRCFAHRKVNFVLSPWKILSSFHPNFSPRFFRECFANFLDFFEFVSQYSIYGDALSRQPFPSL